MKSSNQTQPVLYTEQEAARALGISRARLHRVLDENLFSDGSRRPPDMLFQPSDLVLLRFWNQTVSDPKILRMPRRYR